MDRSSLRRELVARPKIVRAVVAMVGLFLCYVGVLHDVVNVRSLQRAAARGEIAERVVPQVFANVVWAGASLSMLGLILLVAAPGLHARGGAAWRVSFLIGVFLVLTGGVAYLWQPKPAVLLASALGALVSMPLITWPRDFTDG